MDIKQASKELAEIKLIYCGTKDEALDMAIKALKDKEVADNEHNIRSAVGECRTCRHRDPEDKKCDCGGLERQGCPFPVSDDYFCNFYEKGGVE